MNGIAVANDSGTLRFVGIDSITGVSRADHTGAGWSAYTSIAGASGVSPSIIIASGGVNIFGQLNGSIWHSFSGSAGLSDVHALGATSSGGFTMIDAAMAPNNLHLVGIRNGALMHSSRQISGTSWTPFVAFPGPSPAISIVDVAVTRAD